MDVSTCPRTYVHWTHPPLDYPVSLVLPTARTPPCRSVPRHSFPSPCSGRLDSSLRPLRDLSFLTAAKTGTLVTDVIPVTYLTVAWAFGRGPPLPNIERGPWDSLTSNSCTPPSYSGCLRHPTSTSSLLRRDLRFVYHSQYVLYKSKVNFLNFPYKKLLTFFIKTFSSFCYCPIHLVWSRYFLHVRV